MTNSETKTELSDLLFEIGAKLFPRRYHRFKDLRPYEQAFKWARTLDWRQNPHDRFLLRREILHHLESTANISNIASHDEIAAEVDQQINEFPDEFETMGVFSYVFLNARINLASKHSRR